MRMIVLAAATAALVSASGAQAQTQPAAPAAQPSMNGMPNDFSEGYLDHQNNYRKLDDDVSSSARGMRPVPAKAKDVVQGSEVHDAKGLVVGTVATVGSGVAVVAGPLGSVEVDVASFAKNRDGLLINLPKAKIDAMMTPKKPAG